MKSLVKILLSIFIFLFIVVWQRFYILQLTIANDRFDAERKEKNNLQKRLIFKEKELLSIERLEKYAKDTLGMKYASGKDYADDID